MKKMMTALAVMTLAMSVTACGGRTDGDAAATASDGTIAGNWKANVDSASFENDNRDWLLADGTFDCRSCLPPYQTTADGTWQEVDRPGYDGQMIEIVDDNTVKSAARLGEEELGNSTWTVSEDGQSMTIAWNDLEGDEPVSGSTMFTRTGDAPEGAHAVSGQWSVSDIGQIDDAGLMFGFTLDGDTISSSGNGSGYTATLGGEAVPLEGNNAGVMVAVEKIGDNAYRETFTLDGEVTNVTELTVDGDTLSGVSTDPRDNSKVTWTATRQ